MDKTAQSLSSQDGVQEDSVASLLNSINTAVIIDDMHQVEEYFRLMRADGAESFLQEWKSSTELLDEVLNRIETLWLNPTSVQLFQAKSEAELRRSLPHVYAIDPHPFVDFLEATFQGETFFQAEYEQRLASGEHIGLCVTSHMTKIKGRLVSICTFTEKKWYADQMSLAELQSICDRALRGTELGVWELDLQEGEYVVDWEFSNLVGCQPHRRRVAREDLLQCVHVDDRNQFCMLPVDGMIDQEIRFCRADGNTVLIQKKGRVSQRDANDVAIRAAGTVRDITESSRLQKLGDLQKQILESSMEGDDENQLLQKLAQGIDQAFLDNHCFALLLDKERQVVAASAGTSRFDEFATNVVGSVLSDVTPVLGDCLRGNCPIVSSTDLGGRNEWPLAATLSDLGVRVLGWMPVSTIDNEVIGLICLTSDNDRSTKIAGLDEISRLARLVALVIQERRQASLAKLMEQQTQNRQRFASLGRLAGGIAHDFNNLLTSIVTNAQLCELQKDRPADLSAAVKRIVQASDVAASLCRQMLTYSGQVNAEYKSTDLVELVHPLVALVQSSIENRVKVDMTIADDIPTIIGDPGAISQVVLNLLTNAYEAIDERGEIRVYVGAKSLERDEAALYTFGSRLTKGQYVCVSVEDTGCGLDDDAKRHLFDPFYSNKSTGRGLGLSTVIGIVENHRAAILVDSIAGKGARFEVAFPIASVENSAEATDPTTALRDFSAVRILIVDDQQEVSMSIRLLLESQGIDAVDVSSGEEAIVELQSKSYELIFLDQQMPGISGLETYRRLRAANIKTPICFMTGFAETSELRAIDGLDSNTRLLSKPVGLTQLNEIMQHFRSIGTAKRKRQIRPS